MCATRHRPAAPRPDAAAAAAEGLVVAHGDETAAALRQRLSARAAGPCELVCVVDDGGRLAGTVAAAELLTLPDEARLGAVANTAIPRLAALASPERVASEALHHGAAALPLVDAQGRPVGVVGAAALMNTLRREHVEDLHRLAGIARETGRAREALDAPPLRRARHRLPWLLVGLAGCALATFVVSRWEAALAQRPVLAFFVPALVYLADAIGTQSEAVAVRGLSLSHARLARLLGGELRTGGLIGLVLATISFAGVWAVFGDLALAVAVASALAVAGLLAAALGLVLPWTLARLGFDPAYGSGPLATIVQDVATLAIYFGFVSAVVLG